MITQARQGLKAGRRLARGQKRDGDGERGGAGISPEDIADHNSRVVLALLRRHGALTRQELAGHLSLTEPAITGILKRLIAAGVVEQGQRDVGDRYKAAEFSLVAGSVHGLGLWLRPDVVDLALVDLKGHLVLQQTVPSDRLADTVATIRDRCAESLSGIGIACHPGVDATEIERMPTLSNLASFVVKDVEAVVTAERILGIGEPEGGFAVILVDEIVRAGLMTGGRFFRGVHGRAGGIGSMRPGREELTLDEVASAAAYHRHVETFGEAFAEDWMRRAASRLLDAVLALGGFVSPGAVLIGGSLPDAVLDTVIAMMIAERERKGTYFVPASWIPPIRKLTFAQCGVARGAALLPFMELALPKTR
ncbi:MarR family transcriptional regulator [Rhizobium straminoryzae]|uniref:MarR family transcriptional regulator n=1 Tax=Rhizobium straminoryzae TaxID=1387186 RepID=A0A549SVX1_9HYPH|nr:MarR family transcriptional regulator [Rhizobium straminoryzae]